MAQRDYFQQAQKRRYQTRSYRNPHLESRTSIPWKVVAFVLGGFGLVIGLLAGIFGHSMFRIDQIEIKGLEYIDTTTLEASISSYVHDNVFFVFERSNRFLFSSEDLAILLKEQFALANVSIGLQEGTLFIQLEERTSNLFWRTQGKLFVVDLEGVVVREVVNADDQILQQANLSELPIFIDANDVLVDVGSLVLTPKEIEQAFVFFEYLNQANIGYTYIELDRLAGKWARLETEQGYSILFDLTGDVHEQYNNLSVVLQEQVSDPSILEYIDLRFGDKIYFK